VSQETAGYPIRLDVVAIIAGVFDGYVASTISSTWASSWAHTGDAESADMPVSNAAAKSDRLASLIRTAVSIPQGRHYALSAATTSADVDRLFEIATAAMPMIPEEPAPTNEPLGAQTAAAHLATVAVLPPTRPKLPPPPAPLGLLDDGQIAGIKARLRLTPEQAEHWPAVETALRAVAKMQLREMRQRRNSGGKINIDVNGPEVQQLIWAAMPLIHRLREDQKREVRNLARVIGLDEVASRI
jgi:hypothetical protein